MYLVIYLFILFYFIYFFAQHNSYSIYCQTWFIILFIIKHESKDDCFLSKAINPFSSGPVFGQVQKFFLENLLLARFFCWRDISRDLFLAKTLKFFSYRSEKTGKSSHKWDIKTNDHNLDLAVGCTGTSNRRERVNKRTTWFE